MRRTILVLLAAALSAPTTAHAAFFPAETIDGPADITSVGDLDLSRAGEGGVVYLKREDGADRVYLSRFVDGAFTPPVRIDQGFAPSSSQPVIAASDNGRMAIAFVNDGSLYALVKARHADGFSAPALVAQGGVSNPSIDMSINGATYLSWTQNGDVRVARAERDSATFRTLEAPLDIDPAREAGTGPALRSRVAVSADGTALVVWGEHGADGRTHVYARRLFELRTSIAPQDLTLDQVDGHPARGADLPELDMEDDSSYAQVVFRQDTTQGPRIVMRRLVGSAFDPPVVLDGGRYGTHGRLDLTGRGEGLFGVATGDGSVLGGAIWNDRLRTNDLLAGASGVEPQPVAAIGENEDGAIAWIQGPPEAAVVRARYLHDIENPKPEPDATLSRPELGPVDPGAGLDGAASRAGDVAVVFVQQGADGRRLVAGFYDRPPTRIAGSNTTKVRKLTRLAWGASLDLFGRVTYRVFVDGRQLVETQETQYVPKPGQIPDGTHRWQIHIIDRRGQLRQSRTRVLRVDNTPPTLRVSLSKRRRTLTVTARAGDPNGRNPSGLSRVVVDVGNGRFVAMKTRFRHTYARTGRYRVRVKAIDKAGNETLVTRTVRIG
jgi:hypothetical protein